MFTTYLPTYDVVSRLQYSSSNNNISSKYFAQGGSVTRWLNNISILGHLQQWKFPQQCNKLAKIGSIFCQIRNKLSKICKRLVKFCQKNKISPNLVTLQSGHAKIRVSPLLSSLLLSLLLLLLSSLLLWSYFGIFNIPSDTFQRKKVTQRMRIANAMSYKVHHFLTQTIDEMKQDLDI